MCASRMLRLAAFILSLATLFSKNSMQSLVFHAQDTSWPKNIIRDPADDAFQPKTYLSGIGIPRWPKSTN